MNNGNKAFWNKWASRYDRTMSGSRNTYDFIIREIKKTLNRDMTVLELACGTGLVSERIAGSVKMLEATDFSEDMIRKAKEKALSCRLHFSVKDATNLPYAPETFDAVIISNALHVMPSPDKALSEIARVLKSNGILIAPTFTMADTFLGKMQMRIMELSGFKVFHKWSSDAYLKYLNASGFKVIKSCTVGGTAKLTYAEANKINKLKRWIQNGKNDFKD
jgi:ubiquinone/menaquinone biosynthesis C-methylase UbiE